MKKLFTIMSAFTIVAVVAGCSGKTEKTKSSNSDGREYYQTHTDADITRAHAKMYTGAKKTRIGEFKFHETDAGLEMTANLKSLRPETEYNISVFKLKCDDKGDNCVRGNKVATNMPVLKADASGKLEEKFVLRGISAVELTHNEIVLGRAGNDKAGWGKIEKGVLLF